MHGVQRVQATRRSPRDRLEMKSQCRLVAAGASNVLHETWDPPCLDAWRNSLDVPPCAGLPEELQWDCRPPAQSARDRALNFTSRRKD